METRSFGRIEVTLPGLDEPGIYLSQVSSLEGGRGTVQDFHYADASLRDLDLANAHLLSGRVAGLSARRTTFQDVRVDSVEFDGCDFGSVQWADSKLSRVILRNCKLMGAALIGLTMENVLFENCKLDYATFEQVRASGPAVFTGCMLSEARFTGCDLSRAVFDDCTLRLAEFGPGKYQECDLRGNDLSTVRGVGELRKVILDRGQQIQLAEALTAELQITYGDDPHGDH